MLEPALLRYRHMRVRWLVLLVLLRLHRVAGAQSQDLGHRLPAGAGLDAGTQVEQGLYLGDRFVWLGSNRVHDRNGDTIPIQNFDLDTYANVFGIAGTMRLGDLYVSGAVAVPIVKLSVSADVPEASVDRHGFGKVFIKPVQLGARLPHVDVIGSYSLYVPTSQGERAGIGRPELSEQLAAGGTVFFDDRRGWRVSMLTSYLHNHEKRGIRIRRGDTILAQGGAGGPIVGGVSAGVAGYALWQITDDRGEDLPPVLAGARERAFGLGPELTLRVPQIRSYFTARFTWDIDGKARPVGTILVVGVSVIAWR